MDKYNKYVYNILKEIEDLMNKGEKKVSQQKLNNLYEAYTIYDKHFAQENIDYMYCLFAKYVRKFM